MNIFLLILGVLLFILLIVVHEFGHFIVARRGGVETEEFGIGFPPRIWGKKFRKNKGDNTLYSINWIPIGGFVKLKGEHDNDEAPGSFGRASLKRKVLIMLAGVGMNFLAAIVLFTALAWMGMPHLIDGQFHIASDSKVSSNNVIVQFVSKDSPAEQAGLQNNDELISLGSTKITSDEQLRDLTSQEAGKTLGVTYIRDDGGETVTKDVTLNKESVNNQGYLGVGTLTTTLHRSTWSAPIVGVGTALQLSWLTLKVVAVSLFSLVTFNGSEAAANVAGPVGVFEILKIFSHFGTNFVLFIIANVSIALAVMNLLPIPALDGGRLFVILLYRLRKKKLLPEMEERIAATGMIILLILMVVITVVDVRRFYM